MLPEGLTTIFGLSFEESSLIDFGDSGRSNRESVGVGGVTVVRGAVIREVGGVIGRSLVSRAGKAARWSVDAGV